MVMVMLMSDRPHLANEVNMADVAMRAGVSIATVSRALRDVPGVSGATRDRIRLIAEELSYVVSPEASGLAGRGKGRVAVVVPRLDVWFYSAMLASIEVTLRESGLDVLVYQVDGETQRRYFFQHLPSRRKVDAVVLIALPLLATEVERLDLLGVDVVIAGGRLRDLPHVEVDDHAIATTAVRHLVDLGHQRIAMIRTSDTDGTAWSSDILRTRGFTDAMASAGLPVLPDHVVTEAFGVEAGARAMARLLDLTEPPTAVFAYSDEAAISALRTLQRRGLSAPDDVSLLGVDGHPLAALFDLTTVTQDVAVQGRCAAEMALGLIRGERRGPSSVVVPTRLIDRGSTGACAPRKLRPR